MWLEKFVRISGVNTGVRPSKQLVLTEQLFTDGIVNMNNIKQIFFYYY